LSVKIGCAQARMTSQKN